MATTLGWTPSYETKQITVYARRLIAYGSLAARDCLKEVFNTVPDMKVECRQSLQCLLDSIHQGAMEPIQAVGSVALPSSHLTDPSVFLSVVLDNSVPGAQEPSLRHTMRWSGSADK